MSKMQEIITALREIGRPAYATEIAEKAGTDGHTVSAYLNSKAKEEGFLIGCRLIAVSRCKRVALYYLRAWDERVIQMQPPKYVPLRSTLKKRPITDPREFGWHRRGITRYGACKWAWIVNRDPVDLLQKLIMKNCEEAKT